MTEPIKTRHITDKSEKSLPVLKLIYQNITHFMTGIAKQNQFWDYWQCCTKNYQFENYSKQNITRFKTCIKFYINTSSETCVKTLPVLTAACSKIYKLLAYSNIKWLKLVY